MQDREPSRKPLSKEFQQWNKELDGHMANQIMENINQDTPESRNQAFLLSQEFLFSKKTPLTEKNIFEAHTAFKQEAQKRETAE
jgi:hypothetical protein